MTLNELMKVYAGNACITIDGYCDEAKYDYFTMPDEAEEDFSGDNPNYYIPNCLVNETWWAEVKDREVEQIVIIGGGMYSVELFIKLKSAIGMQVGCSYCNGLMEYKGNFNDYRGAYRYCPVCGREIVDTKNQD